MADPKQCPLKVVSPKQIEDTTCDPNCAWYHKDTQMCAIKVIAAK